MANERCEPMSEQHEHVEGLTSERPRIARPRILLADDHKLLVDAVSVVLEKSGYHVSAANDFHEATQALNDGCRPDLVLLDLNMPGMTGIASVASVVKGAGAGHVALFSGRVEDGFLRAALELGVRGSIPKTLPLRSLVSVIELIRSGQVYVPATSILSRAESDGTETDLSATERSVLRMAAEGKKNKEIAYAMQLGEARVKMHLRNICRKIGARNRAHAAVIAREIGTL